jgi:preprotein translocase subunit SecB
MTEETQQKTSMPVHIRKQYVKDLSFENPNAPGVLESDEPPEMGVRFNMGSNLLDKDNNIYEVTLGVTAQAKRGQKTAFIAEIEYGMEVQLEGVPEEQIHPMLYIEMPRQAFPFVRQIIANLTQMGGYSPLLMRPVDFRALYLQNFGEELESPEEKMVKQEAV